MNIEYKSLMFVGISIEERFDIYGTGPFPR